MMILRQFHTARAMYSVEKSALAKLRKSTGYSFSKCKEALEKHSNDCKQAEQWLRAEAQAHGWEKATKLQGRATAQGLISVLANSNNAVMVETNCETDFVSRNKRFHSLVQRVTQGCFHFSADQSALSGNTVLSKVPLSADQLANILLAESRPVKDETALGIGELGENIQNRRAICFKAVAPVHLAGLTHPIPEGGVKKDVVQSGRYGVIVAYKPKAGGKSSPKNSARLEDIGRQLCQHIIGMNPTEIGTMKTAVRSPDPVEEEPKAAEQASTEAESEQAATPYYDADETTLLNQEFLMDPDMTVGEYLIENEVEVLDFTRFECGEKIEPSQHG